MDVRRALGVSGLVLAAAMLPGCSPPPPSEEAILWYFRNVPIHGEVRRVWPAGQAYVDKVLKAHAAVMKSLEPLAAQTTPLSLWPIDDPRWQDAQAVKRHTSELEELAIGARHRRDVLLGELEEALRATPEGLELDTPEAKEAFLERAWAALSPPGGELHALRATLEVYIDERLALYRMVRDDGAARNTQAFAAAHRALEAEFRAAREGSIALAEERLDEIGRRLASLNKRQERDEYGTLFWEQKYHRDLLQDIPKRVYAARETARKELARLRKQAPPQKPEARTRYEARVAFLEAQIERLAAEHEALKKRIGKLIKPADVATDEPESGG